ncbi:MAG: THxN family PEP-CTERM protein [Congregibacter sp.]
MKTMNKVLAKTALAVVLGTGAVGASADLITQWTATVTGEWSTAPGDTVFSGGSGLTYESSDLLSWGADLGPAVDPVNGANSQESRSGLQIGTSPVMGMVDTNGAAIDTIEVTHFNNTIFGEFATLESAVFLTTLTLTPLAPVAGPSLPTVSQTIPIMFQETPNIAANCTAASVTVCDDIFVFEPESLTFDFSLDGFTYFTQIGAPGLGVLADDECAQAGAASGCLGLTTPEQEASTVVFNFQISARPNAVPAPATLALLGMGLLGFAARKRRA